MANRIEILLSHVVVLEERLDSRPSDIAEQRRRDDLIRFVLVYLLRLVFKFPPVSLKK